MSGSIMNIAGLTPVEDPSYRYKMPRIQGKVEGRGNGIKTVLTNVTDVGLALNREAPEITKFFGCELGSQTTYSAETDRAIVNGSHTDRDLQQHLSRYIENFVLCKSCRLPETYYKIKTGIISQKCNACGAKHPVDMTHKLTTFMLACHKKQRESSKSDKKDKDREKEKEKKSRKTDADGEEKKSKREKAPKVTEGDEAEDNDNSDEAAAGAGVGSADVEENEGVAIGESQYFR
jgi:translation initiation factor 5